MSNELAVRGTFEDRVKARMKESIADLLSDDDLNRLVARGMDEVFFNPRPNPRYSSYGSGRHEPEQLPPLLHQMVTDLLQPSVTAAVARYIKEHEQQVMSAISSSLQIGAGEAVLKAVAAAFQNELCTLQGNIANRLQQAGVRL